MTGSKMPPPDPFGSIWRACWLIFGSIVLLNLTVAYLEPILPWLFGAIAIALVLRVVVAVIRWRRNRW